MGVPVFMLIDDEPINNIVHKKILQKRFPDSIIQVFTNPNTALEYLSSHQTPIPDLILIDINMPEMDAWEFLDALPPAGNWPKTYICSGSEDEKDLKKVENYTLVKGFLQKPIDITLIEQIINA